MPFSATKVNGKRTVVIQNRTTGTVSFWFSYNDLQSKYVALSYAGKPMAFTGLHHDANSDTLSAGVSLSEIEISGHPIVECPQLA